MHFLLPITILSATLDSVLCGNGYNLQYSYDNYGKYGLKELYGMDKAVHIPQGPTRLISSQLTPSILPSVHVGSRLHNIGAPYLRPRIRRFQSVRLGPGLRGIHSSHLAPSINGVQSVRLSSKLGRIHTPYLSSSIGGLKSVKLGSSYLDSFPSVTTLRSGSLGSKVSRVRSSYLAPSVHSMKSISLSPGLRSVRSNYLSPKIRTLRQISLGSRLDGARGFNSVSLGSGLGNVLPSYVGPYKSGRLRSKISRVSSSYLSPNVGALKAVSLGSGLGSVRGLKLASVSSSSLHPRVSTLKSVSLGSGLGSVRSLKSLNLGKPYLTQSLRYQKSPNFASSMVVNDGTVVSPHIGGRLLSAESFIGDSIGLSDFSTPAFSTQFDNGIPAYTKYENIDSNGDFGLGDHLLSNGIGYNHGASTSLKKSLYPSAIGGTDLSSMTYSKLYSAPIVSKQLESSGLKLAGYGDVGYDADLGLDLGYQQGVITSMGNGMYPNVLGASDFSSVKYENPVRKYSSKLLI